MGPQRPRREQRTQRTKARGPLCILCILGVLCGLVSSLGCRQDMHDQPKFKPLAKNTFFADNRSARPQVTGTVARGQLREDAHLYTGKMGGAFVEVFPFPVTEDVLRSGRERYQIFCTPCHGQLGKGDGIIVQRGYRKPSSLHIDRLRNEKPGYFFDVITNGFGAMPDYAAQVPVKDRWAIAAYIRALQLSQNATLEDVPAEHRKDLAAPVPPPSAPGETRHQ